MNKIRDGSYISILGVKVFSRTKKEILEIIEKYLKKVKNQKSKIKNREVKPYPIFTPNAEIIVYAKKHKKFRQIINQAEIALPDGISVVWASWLFNRFLQSTKGKEIKKRISGIDFVADLCRLAVKNRLTVGLIGGRAKLALSALECLKKEFPGLKGWADNGPEIKLRIRNYELGIREIRERELGLSTTAVKRIIDNIVSRKTSILFVGFGHPKQEYFIDLLSGRLTQEKYANPIVLMSVGGAFDLLSGRIKRAPIWLQQMGLEWWYRLLREPWRIRRQLALIEFMKFFMIDVFVQLRKRDWVL